MCTDCNCGNKRAIPWGAIGRRWAQPGRKQKLAGWGRKCSLLWREGREWARKIRGRGVLWMYFPQTHSKKEIRTTGWLKPSPRSTADPELIGISVNSAAGAGEHVEIALSLWLDGSDPSETHIRGERQWIIKNKWGVKAEYKKGKNQNIYCSLDKYCFIFVFISTDVISFRKPFLSAQVWAVFSLYIPIASSTVYLMILTYIVIA